MSFLVNRIGIARLVGLFAVLASSWSAAENSEPDERVVAIRNYLAVKFDEFETIKEGGTRHFGLSYNPAADLQKIDIPELRPFLPDTDFYVTKLLNPEGWMCYLHVEVVVAIRPGKEGFDCRNCLSPIYAAPSEKFLRLFSGLPADSPDQRRQLAAGIGRTLAAVTAVSEVKFAHSDESLIRLELLHQGQYWRSIAVAFDDQQCLGIEVESVRTDESGLEDPFDTPAEFGPEEAGGQLTGKSGEPAWSSTLSDPLPSVDFEQGDLVPCPEDAAEYVLTVDARRENQLFYRHRQGFRIYRGAGPDPRDELGMSPWEQTVCSMLVGGFASGSLQYLGLSPESVELEIDWNASSGDTSELFSGRFQTRVQQSGTADAGHGNTFHWWFAKATAQRKD